MVPSGYGRSNGSVGGRAREIANNFVGKSPFNLTFQNGNEFFNDVQLYLDEISLEIIVPFLVSLIFVVALPKHSN